MKNDLKHRMLNATISPPENAWQNIANALDKENYNDISNRLQNATIEPPIESWNIIEAILNENRKPASISIRKKIISWSIAALVVGLIVTGVFYFRSNQAGPVESKVPQTANIPSVKNEQSPAENIIAEINNNPTPVPISNFQKPTVTPKKDNAIRYASLNAPSVNNTSNEKPEPVKLIDNEISSASSTQVNPPDYFIVTAPNGQPVRISNKFSEAANYLFNTSTDNNSDNSWKKKFDNWRNKLISNPSFIPTASNFLDIVELQELLRDQ